ncbi:hypothetical protein SETIT_7G297900v2 [Setaria italica]|uniref:Uncharacterized protein n=2 Tax=Setaria TaxID=4554 RepID=A0A368S164_SETIT|nr:hypothetical protein SETIT_7G297900v2 [Setaria italica]TKW07474.1 hypothetical protein SEVIR_7G309700v2 [Setaria viridis]
MLRDRCHDSSDPSWRSFYNRKQACGGSSGGAQCSATARSNARTSVTSDAMEMIHGLPVQSSEDDLITSLLLLFFLHIITSPQASAVCGAATVAIRFAVL